MVRGPLDKILSVGPELGLAIDPHFRLSDTDLQSEEATISEVVVSQKADFQGQTLEEMEFRTRYNLTVLAIWHQEKPIVDRIGNVRLQLGDTLLVQGRREQVRHWRAIRNFWYWVTYLWKHGGRIRRRMRWRSLR